MASTGACKLFLIITSMIFVASAQQQQPDIVNKSEAIVTIISSSTRNDNATAGQCTNSSQCVAERTNSDAHARYVIMEDKTAAILNDPLRPVCPESFAPDDNPNNLYILCRPRSCAISTDTTSSLTNNSISNDESNSSILPNATSTQLSAKPNCKKFSTTFSACTKMVLREGEFSVIGESGMAKVFVDGSQRSLGNYFRQKDTLLVCTDHTSNGTSPGVETDTVANESLRIPQWCYPFAVPEDSYTISANGNLITKSIKSDVINPRYYFRTTDANGTSIMNLCYKISLNFRNCDLIVFDRNEQELLPDMRLWTHKHDETLVYDLGDFILSRDHSKATACLVPRAKSKSLSPYGIMAAVSSFFLLLTLLAHLWIPNLNLHCKPLICLLLSLFLFYLGLAVQNLAGPFSSIVADYAIFITRYVMGVSSFFWLNVQSFDMWHGFANLIRGAATRTSARDKRRFFIKCGYAWGVPVLLCAAVLGINGSESAQRALNLQLDIGGTGWFHSTKSIFIFFYVPIIIILIENVIFFALTIVNIRKASKGTDILNKRVSRQLLVVFAKLFVVMGICWFFEILSFALANRTSESAWYFTDSINLLQGVFIFFVYVFKRATIKIIRAKLGYPMENGGSQVTKSTSSSQQDNRKTSVASAGNQAKKKGVEMTTKVAEGKQNGGEREDCQTKC